MPDITRRVVVGVRGSPGSLYALRLALEQARESGAALMPVIGWEPVLFESCHRA